MANVQHSALTDPNIHEPKGIAAATINKVYVSDGAGGGAWKVAYSNGMEFYKDVVTTGTPVDLTLADTNYKITNDGGAGTDLGEAFPGSTPIYNVSTQQFEFNTAGAQIGDSVDIEIDVDVVNSGANGEYTMSIDIATGSATAFNHPIAVLSVKTASTKRMVGYFSLSLHNSDQLNYPATLQLQSDSTGDTFIVNHFVVRHVFQKVRYV